MYVGRCKIYNDMFIQLHCTLYRTCIYGDALILLKSAALIQSESHVIFLHRRSLPTRPGAADPSSLL